MKKIKFFAALLILVTIPLVQVNAYDMKNVIAYPVPFNPKKHTAVTIENQIAPLTSAYNINVEIFDINGDSVRTLSGVGPQLVWNGRDSSGRYVKPGLYMIKVTVENSSTGDYGKKVIRILVDY